ncbi:MAG TPA: SHOCT domain-containing protein [Flavobacterium sp.]|jgi:riboflavin synthase alpha subunit
MKKFFGIVFLFVGMALTVVGALVFSEASKVVYEDQLRWESSNEDQQVFGSGYIAVGGIVFVMGIVLTASKTNAQREKEVELQLIKDSLAGAIIQEDPYNQIEKLGKLKERGLLTEEEFQQQKVKLLRLV